MRVCIFECMCAFNHLRVDAISISKNECLCMCVFSLCMCVFSYSNVCARALQPSYLLAGASFVTNAASFALMLSADTFNAASSTVIETILNITESLSNPLYIKWCFVVCMLLLLLTKHHLKCCIVKEELIKMHIKVQLHEKVSNPLYIKQW